MINWINKKIFRPIKAEQNPYYNKIRKLVLQQEKALKYNKIFFLGGFEYSEKNYLSFKECIDRGGISSFLEKYKYNTQANNIEIYLIENDESNYLVTILDSLELLNGEQILDIIKSPIIELKNTKLELIYSKE